MKTKEELTKLKNEVESVRAKLRELTDEELKIVTGGFEIPDEEHKYQYSLYKDKVIPDNPPFNPPFTPSFDKDEK